VIKESPQETGGVQQDRLGRDVAVWSSLAEYDDAQGARSIVRAVRYQARAVRGQGGRQDSTAQTRGERERGSLESLLLAPAPRRAIVLGKGIAAVSLWMVAFALSLPYIWWLGRDVETFGVALFGGFVVGSLLALFLAGLGLLMSTFSTSNGLSLSVSFLALLALYAPNQMPTNALRGWAGELLLRVDPSPVVFCISAG
jgi:ABC-type multidrug transport system permease subunit